MMTRDGFVRAVLGLTPHADPSSAGRAYDALTVEEHYLVVGAGPRADGAICVDLDYDCPPGWFCPQDCPTATLDVDPATGLVGIRGRYDTKETIERKIKP